MIKGINKQMVVMRLDGNSIYEGACFILKNEKRGKDEADKDMLAEANRIVLEASERKKRKPKGSRLARFFAACGIFLIGTAAGFCLSLLFIL